jgi:RimJ/RimL family protein N-acetyltransferase
MFAPIRTERLSLRQVRAGDAASVSVRRSDPETAKLQSWEVPYPLVRAQALIDAVLEMDGPASDEWYLIAVADPGSDEMLGDLALYLKWGGRTAEIGYTFDPVARGQGFATEAVAALLDYLFTVLDVNRIEASIHPDNTASARVLERTGFLYEGLTRSDHWVGDVVTDTGHYAILRPDFDAWRLRPRRAPEVVRLVEIDAGNERDVSKLRTHKTQESFVAPIAESFADALFPETVDGATVVPWMRAVEADGELVGFVMLALATEHHINPYLWRLLIDRRHQRRGIGRRALDAVMDECRAWGDTTMTTSWAIGPGSPEPFYRVYGFEPTGRMIDGEIEGRRPVEVGYPCG